MSRLEEQLRLFGFRTVESARDDQHAVGGVRGRDPEQEVPTSRSIRPAPVHVAVLGPVSGGSSQRLAPTAALPAVGFCAREEDAGHDVGPNTAAPQASGVWRVANTVATDYQAAAVRADEAPSTVQTGTQVLQTTFV